jgi:hypothetical protein
MGGMLWALILLFLIALVAVLLVRRGPFRQLGVDASLLTAAAAVSARIQLRNVIALLAAITVASLLVGYAFTNPAGLGRTVFAAPLLTAAVGIGFFIIVPAFHESSDRRSAELSPRTALSFAPRPALFLAGALVLVVVAACIAFGLVAEPDGRSLSYRAASYSSGASPFPGFFYGVPVLLSLALLVAISLTAVLRVSRARMPSDESLREADAAIRQLAIRVILQSAAAGCAVSLGVMLVAAGGATSSVAGGVRQNGAGGLDPFLQVVPVVENLLAVVFVIGGCVFAISAITNALRKPLALTAVPA